MESLKKYVNGEISIVVLKPIQKSLEEFAEIAIAFGRSVIPYYKDRLWFSVIEKYPLKDKLLILIPLTIYTSPLKFNKYLVYPSLELKDSLDGAYTYAFRLVDENDDPNPLLKICYELWKEVIE